MHFRATQFFLIFQPWILWNLSHISFSVLIQGRLPLVGIFFKLAPSLRTSCLPIQYWPRRYHFVNQKRQPFPDAVGDLHHSTGLVSRTQAGFQPLSSGLEARVHVNTSHNQRQGPCLLPSLSSSPRPLDLLLGPPRDPAFTLTWLHGLCLWIADLSTLLADSAPKAHWLCHGWDPGHRLFTLPGLCLCI